MNASGIVSHRLINQQIVQTKFKKPRELVAWMGAMQAQDFVMAKWAIGLRLKGVKDGDVEKAFNDGAILRTHVLRPTWHFVMPEDIRWMIKLTAPRIIPLLAYNNRRFGLDKKVFTRSNDALAKALQGGKQLTRDELRSVLQKERIATDDLRFIHLMIHAELDGIVCSGPRKRKQFTYALLFERAPNPKLIDQEEALAELTGRYFVSRGPATLQDFAWWSGLSMADAKKGVEMMRKDFKKEVVDGREYFFTAASPIKRELLRSTYLLPNYDEYIVAYKDRSILFDKKHSAKIAIRTNAIFNNSILVNGKLEGSWKRVIKNNSVVIETEYFGSLSKAKEKTVAMAAKKYAEFVGKVLK